MQSDLQMLHNKLLEMLKDLDSFCKKNDIKYTLAYGSVLGAVRHKGFIPWDDDLDICMTYENYTKFINFFENNDKYFLQRDTIDHPLQFSKLRCNNTALIEKIVYRKPYRNMHQGVFIDIFCLDKFSKNKFQKTFQLFFANILRCQSLFIRGYQTKNILKHLCIFFSLCFMPIRKFMLSYVKKFNNLEDFDYYFDLADPNHNVFEKEIFSMPFQYCDFEDGIFPIPSNSELYLKNKYGNYMELPSKEAQKASIHAEVFSVSESYKNFLKD